MTVANGAHRAPLQSGHWNTCRPAADMECWRR